MEPPHAVHVHTTARTYKDTTYRSHLLRQSYREDGKVKKRTLANLTPLGDDIVEAIRRMLAGERLVRLDQVLRVASSTAHGHVAAVRRAMERLGMDQLLGSRPSKEKRLVLAMIAARVLAPDTKLATTRWWRTTTLPEVFDVSWADEDDLYAAMDWLVERQGIIEKKLAGRHLQNDGLVLYDLSSTYVEGQKCPLAALGHNRDGKAGKKQINFGLVTDGRGCPVSVSVFKGNTGDPTTVPEQVRRVREDFGIERMVFVGDRGMLTSKQIRALADVEGVDWISALRTEGITKLVNGGAIQLGLFDERNLFELSHPDFPGERLVACRNPDLARHRAAKRQALLEATVAALQKVQGSVERGRLKGQDKIGLRVGKVIGKYKMGKHFDLVIGESSLEFSIAEDRVKAEAALDGLYVVRTSVPAERLDAAGAVRSYKQLANVERAFRSMKTVDLEVRPLHHRLEDRVKAHVFLCMLAYYVKWHLLEAWRPLLFADEDQAAKTDRDPVAPAKRSKDARKKAARKRLDDGTEAHSLRSLLGHLATLVRNQCRRHGGEDGEPTVAVDTEPNPKQKRALELLEGIGA